MGGNAEASPDVQGGPPSRAAFTRDVHRLWAERYGCDPTVLRQPGTRLIPKQRSADERGVHLWIIGEHRFAEVDPVLAPPLEQWLATMPPTHQISVEEIAHVLSSEPIDEVTTGHLYYLHPPDLRPFTVPERFWLRPLTMADAPALAALQADCTPEEVDESYVEVDHLVAFGIFDGASLVAAASGYRWGGFLDPGVITHPAHRRQGLGRAVVGTLARWAIEHDIIPQYRHNTDNPGSAGVALRLGFRHFFVQHSIWMTGEKG